MSEGHCAGSTGVGRWSASREVRLRSARLANRESKLLGRDLRVSAGDLNSEG
jgi:adhesin HecA-like repeat protein